MSRPTASEGKKKWRKRGWLAGCLPVLFLPLLLPAQETEFLQQGFEGERHCGLVSLGGAASVSIGSSAEKPKRGSAHKIFTGRIARPPPQVCIPIFTGENLWQRTIWKD